MAPSALTAIAKRRTSFRRRLAAKSPCALASTSARIDASNTCGGVALVKYDSLGNIIEEGTNGTGCGPHYKYTYDAENRISYVYDGGTGSTIAAYVYDAFSRRVQKLVAGNTTDYFYNLTGKVVSTMSAAGTQLSGGWAGSAHVATYASPASSPALYYVLADNIGTERVRTDSSGTAVNTCANVPYGEGLTCTYAGGTSDVSPFHYGSYERDSETGLDHMQFRYYNSRLGRFMSADLLSGSSDDPQSLNGFGYVMNNPTNAIDPLGLTTLNLFLDMGDAMRHALLGTGGQVGVAPASITVYGTPDPLDPWLGDYGDFTGPIVARLQPVSLQAPAGRLGGKIQANLTGLARTMTILNSIPRKEEPCKGRTAGDLNYYEPRMYSDGPDTPANHIMLRHILPGSGNKSKYAFDGPPVVGSPPSATWNDVKILNALTFAFGTGGTSRGNYLFTLHFPPIPEVGGGQYGIGYDQTGAVSGWNSLLTEKNCTTPVTSHPGLPN